MHKANRVALVVKCSMLWYALVRMDQARQIYSMDMDMGYQMYGRTFPELY